jgi:D-sedoheptulose 7-phosphate isomerase
MKPDIKKSINDSIMVKQRLLSDRELLDKISNLAEVCVASLRRDGKVIFAGNGGSFADAQHLSAELTSRFMFDREPLSSIVLGANSSAISAIGNDYGYTEVFSRELRGIGRANDIFIPISTSGNSENILNAISVAKSMRIQTVGMTGSMGGKMSSLSDCIVVPAQDTARIQECHILIGHIICEFIEHLYFKT